MLHSTCASRTSGRKLLRLRRSGIGLANAFQGTPSKLPSLELEWLRFIPGCDLERMPKLQKNTKPSRAKCPLRTEHDPRDPRGWSTACRGSSQIGATPHAHFVASRGLESARVRKVARWTILPLEPVHCANAQTANLAHLA